MKRMIKTSILLVLLIVLCGGYWAVTQLSNEETAVVSEADGDYPVVADGSVITSLEWTSDETTYAFAKSEETWVCSSEAGYPLDQESFAAFIEDLADVSASRKLENASALEDYGLDSPSFEALITVDEQEQHWKVGDATPFGDGFYFTADDISIYILDASIASLFPDDLSAFAHLESLPAFDGCTQISITSAEQTEVDQSFADPDWHRTGAPDELSDSDAVTELKDALQALTFASLVDWHAEDLAPYGLDEASVHNVTVTDGETEVLCLLVGHAETTSGDYYAMLPNSPFIYLIDADTGSLITETTDADLRDMTLPIPAYGELKELSYTVNDRPMTLSKPDESSDDTFMEELYETISDLSGNGVAKENALKDELILSLTLTNDQDVSVTYAFYAYGVDHYLADNGTQRSLLVDADTIDRLIRQLKSRSPENT